LKDQEIKIETTLSLMEAFYTIQGEGFYQGHAAYFIRLGGCDVGCHWCDVKDSWDADKHPKVEISKIVEDAAKNPSRLVVITGGEPLMHNLQELCVQLHLNNFNINIETSGAYEISGSLDWICLSPKKFKKPLPSVIAHADELKIIVYNNSDFEWAESFLPFLKPGCKLFLQPEWSKSNEMLPKIIDYVKLNPNWEVSLQIHKFMNIP